MTDPLLQDPVVRLTLAALTMVLAISGASAQVKVPTGSAKFLAFPSSDSAVVFNQAWYYEASGLKDNYCSYPKGDISGYGRHCAIDYSKRGPNGNVTFAVTATADGIAYRQSSSDGKMTIEHSNGFCSRFSHLDGGRPVIPVGQKIAVKRGQLVAWAGKTNTRAIHLHFVVRVGGCSGQPVDPYDIAAPLLDKRIAPIKAYYPGGTKFAGCGPNPLWLTCSSGTVTNRPPVAGADTAEIEPGTATTIPVLANDTDPDDDPLTITKVTVPSEGTATISTDKESITYQPRAGFRGSDSFTYTVSDGRGGTALGSVAVTVGSSEPPAPVALGCFKDEGTVGTLAGRALDGLRTDDQIGMTVAKCASICAGSTAGFRFFGVQAGYACFCDKDENYDKYGSAPGKCTKPCPGDTTEICGGDWANSVYRLP